MVGQAVEPFIGIYQPFDLNDSFMLIERLLNPSRQLSWNPPILIEYLKSSLDDLPRSFPRNCEGLADFLENLGI